MYGRGAFIPQRVGNLLQRLALFAHGTLNKAIKTLVVRDHHNCLTLLMSHP